MHMHVVQTFFPHSKISGGNLGSTSFVVSANLKDQAKREYKRMYLQAFGMYSMYNATDARCTNSLIEAREHHSASYYTFCVIVCNLRSRKRETS